MMHRSFIVLVSALFVATVLAKAAFYELDASVGGHIFNAGGALANYSGFETALFQFQPGDVVNFGSLTLPFFTASVAAVGQALITPELRVSFQPLPFSLQLGSSNTLSLYNPAAAFDV